MPYRNIFNKIIFCTDFNSDAMTAFQYALNIAAGNKDVELMILHVIPEPEAQFWKSYIYEVEDVDIKAKNDIDEKIAKLYSPLIPEGIKWTSKFLIGNVGEEILKTAHEEKANLLVIGRGAGANFINRMLGNFTEKVVRKAACPVLVVPDEEK